MNGFDNRINKGKILHQKVVKYLNENGIAFFETGYEYLKSINGAHNLIKKSEDQTSKFIRYYPDVSLVFKSESFLLEIKHSSGIEKECYFNYLSLAHNLKIHVLLFLKNEKICKIEDLKFNLAYEYDKISGLKIPIDDNVWREPRRLPKQDYYKYLEAYNNRTSGCSFAFIDFDNTVFYDLDILKEFL